jgi:hypothetical protein
VQKDTKTRISRPFPWEQEYSYPYEDSLFLHQFLTSDGAAYAVRTDNSGGLEAIATPLGQSYAFGLRPTLGLYSLYILLPWTLATYTLDGTGRVLRRSLGRNVVEFQDGKSDESLSRRWKTKTMELNQEVAMEDDRGGWWVNHTVADKFFRKGFHSAYAISADGQTIRNIQSFALESGEREGAPHADYTCRKSTKDFRVDCEGTLMTQPIAYSVTYDRTNQLPSSVNGFDIISSLQTTAFRHAKRGIQV